MFWVISNGYTSLQRTCRRNPRKKNWNEFLFTQELWSAGTEIVPLPSHLSTFPRVCSWKGFTIIIFHEAVKKEENEIKKVIQKKTIK